MPTSDSPDLTADLIARLDRWLSANRPAYYARLRPGAADVDLNELERIVGLTLPESFRSFFRWRDGQTDDGSESIQDNFMFLSLAAIRDTKELLDGMIGHDFESPDWWRREWVPFLHNGGGDHRFIDLTPTAAGYSPPVRQFWHDLPDRPWLHQSFQGWLAALVESMEYGRYRVV